MVETTLKPHPEVIQDASLECSANLQAALSAIHDIPLFQAETYDISGDGENVVLFGQNNENIILSYAGLVKNGIGTGDVELRKWNTEPDEEISVDEEHFLVFNNHTDPKTKHHIDKDFTPWTIVMFNGEGGLAKLIGLPDHIEDTRPRVTSGLANDTEFYLDELSASDIEMTRYTLRQINAKVSEFKKSLEQ